MTDNELATVVANNIWQTRETRGMTVPQLARAAGISKAYLYEVEYARANVSLRVACAIAQALHTTVDALTSDENDYPRPDSDGAL